MHLVAPEIMTAIAEVGAYGAEKYGFRNWEKGFAYSVMYSSLLRHLVSWWQGEDVDQESRLPHTYHIAWGIHAIIEHERRIKEGTLPLRLDDRPQYGRVEQI